MTRKSNRGPDPSELTLRMLCANAAGRCQFEGCNKPVFFDGLTLREFNKSNVAHIVSSSSSGPRGDVLRSHQLSDKLCNLMLLCPDHHKLIDDFPNSYPEADLLEMKRKHEEAIATQCGLIYKEPSEVLMVSSPIKGRTPVTVNFNQCADAVMPEKRVASVRGQRIKVEIEEDYHSPGYWESAVRALNRRFGLTVSAILEEDPNAHFSVFPLAPMPLIMKLGYMIGDKARADVFQFSRACDSWNWSTKEQTNSFSAKKQVVRDGGRIALVFSLTADIATTRITEVYDADIRLFDQMMTLRVSYPSASCELRKGTLYWRGKVKPTPLSREYNVTLTYDETQAPKVWVSGEDLQKIDDEDFPHNYGVDSENNMVQICLYRHREFTKDKFLANTIIPWTVEWLYFYEIWLATGEWCGGGEHPGESE